MTKKQPKQPCVGCGALVPEKHEYPYRGCKKTCPLASEWRKQHAKTNSVAILHRLKRKIQGEARMRERTALGLNSHDGRLPAWVRQDAAATWMRLVESWVNAEIRKAKK